MRTSISMAHFSRLGGHYHTKKNVLLLCQFAQACILTACLVVVPQDFQKLDRCHSFHLGKLSKQEYFGEYTRFILKTRSCDAAGSFSFKSLLIFCTFRMHSISLHISSLILHAVALLFFFFRSNDNALCFVFLVFLICCNGNDTVVTVHKQCCVQRC